MAGKGKYTADVLRKTADGIVAQANTLAQENPEVADNIYFMIGTLLDDADRACATLAQMALIARSEGTTLGAKSRAEAVKMVDTLIDALRKSAEDADPRRDHDEAPFFMPMGRADKETLN